MRILVTGADGFLGSHAARRLERAGHEVVRAIYLRAPIREGEVRVDLTRPEQLARLPAALDVIVHAAGMVDGHAPRGALFAANLHATQQLVRWAEPQRIRHFVHLSSVAVYGPLALGEERSERTPRLGLALGLPYMRSKARAERVVEASGIPYTLLRPPVVVGRGDTVLSRGFRDALCARGLPWVPGARERARVSLVSADGVAEIVRLLVERGPLHAPLHAVDFQLTFRTLAQLYARVLGRTCRYTEISWQDAVRSRDEAGFAWLVASASFGQHYKSERLLTELGYQSPRTLESAVEDGLSSLQGGTESLF
jgi:nucleoside-diphosphate-sugar epimerase